MTPPHPSEGPGPLRYACEQAAADGVTAASVREDFARWLRHSTNLTETRLCDVVLAVNEALANAVEFAYRGTPGGTVDIEAVHDPWREVLTVTISDQGHWRDGDPLCNNRARGRGILLMRTLADAVVIDTSALGTSVCLRFDNVRVARPVGAVVS